MATSGYKDHTAKGYGQIKTYYKSHERFYVNEKKNSISSVKPTFECAKGVNNTYSRYTVNSESITRGVSVNNDLTYPIGLLSADEMIFAGTYPNITDSNGSAIYRNQNFYLYKRSENVWSMTPADFRNPSSNRFAEVFTISSDEKGALSVEIVSTYHTYTLHPVINLKENIKVESGDGTKDNPYIISL